jgi:hypothetical protein
MQHCGEPAIAGFPQENDILQRELLDICVDVPAPVVEAVNLSVALAPIVEQKRFAQKGANAPVIVFVAVGTQCKAHHSLVHESCCGRSQVPVSHHTASISVAT